MSDMPAQDTHSLTPYEVEKLRVQIAGLRAQLDKLEGLLERAKTQLADVLQCL